MKIPCENCVVLAICKGIDSNLHVAKVLKILSQRCSILKDYIELDDLDIDMSRFDLTLPMENRMFVNVPLSKRILKIYDVMNWDNKDLNTYKLLAKGKMP